VEVKSVPLTQLLLDSNNARKHNQRNLEAIAESLKLFGQRKPIVVHNGVVIAGNGTLEAAKSLGWTEITVAEVPSEWTEDTAKAFALTDNRTAELAEWDENILAKQLLELQDADWDISELGFDAPLPIETESVDEDEIPEPPVEPITKLGNIYQLGRHRLMCGNSTDKATVERLMDGAKADMVLTDPPYGMFLDTDFSSIKGSMKSIGSKNGTQGNKYDKVIGDHDDFTPELITTIFTNFNQAKEMFLFGGDYFAELLPNKNNGSWLVWDKRKDSQADAIGAEFELIWSKQKHKRRMLRHDWFGFLSSQNVQDARNRVHPTQKPITLLVDIMKQWGDENDKIVDIYGGSGSTLIAAEQTNRICYMMELDPKYCDVIVTRWENLTNQKAKLVTE
jgi:site-specific DNA-methyltransferase (adenine-specific)